MSNDSKELDRYLKDIQRALGGIKKSERLEIVEEIKSHILEMKGDSPDKSLEDVIEQFGPARKIAKNYLEERGDDLTVSSSPFSVKIVLIVAVVLFVSLLSLFLFNRNSGENKVAVQRQGKIEAKIEQQANKSNDVDSPYGKHCVSNVGKEPGVTCDTLENCSTREFVNGCCIFGTCVGHTNEVNDTQQEGEKCIIHTGERGEVCDSAENCSTGPAEFTDGCCINGKCLNQ